ncbi:MAG TPA: hypothetical protein VI933_01130 [archaeon]|nr:hypothetical protein [archaeon]
MQLSIPCAPDFDFEKILMSKPFYFFYSPEPERKVFLDGQFFNLSFKQSEQELIINVDKKLNPAQTQFLKSRIQFCLGTNENMGRFYEMCKADLVLHKLLPRIRGTRMVSAFSDFEALVGCIISQNNSFRNYLATMQHLYQELNFEPKNYLQPLRKFKVGYKEQFLQGLAKLYLQNFRFDGSTKIKGLGKYSFALFDIFQRRNFAGFYWDTLTERILREHYKISTTEKTSHAAAQKLWGDYCGLAEILLQKFLNDTVKV